MNNKSPPSLTPPRNKPLSRSCTECYRRKLRCDRAQICSNCRRGCNACVYTNEPIRRDRKSKRRALGLADRLASQNASEGPLEKFQARAQAPAEDAVPIFKPLPGHLVTGKHGKSRLLGDTCWARPSIELLGVDNEGGHGYFLTASTMGSLSYESFLFSKTTPQVQVEMANPSFHQIRYLWEIYVHNVDPLVKILHRPSVERILNDLSQNKHRPDPEIRALLLAICYAAVSSLPSSQIRAEFAFDIDSYVGSFRTALEKALVDAQFPQSHDLRVLQAFIIYLTCLPRKEARNIALLISLAVRISRAMGLHRDGSIFELPPFETEIRRRLWWHLCILDWRAAEDAGLEITIMPSTFDTKMPLNINDDDMDIDSSHIPARQDYTDMIFSLIRYETWSLIASWSSTNISRPQHKSTEIEERKKALEDLSKYLQNTYLSPCTTISTPFARIISMVTPLLIAKLQLITSYPAYCDGARGEIHLTPEDKESLFKSAIDLLEFEQSLGADYELVNWRWFFANAHVQWHAMSFALAELCVRVEGEVEYMAWDVIERVFPSAPLDSERKDNNIWEPLQGLKQKALSVRYSFASQLSATFPSDTGNFVFDGFPSSWS